MTPQIKNKKIMGWILLLYVGIFTSTNFINQMSTNYINQMVYGDFSFRTVLVAFLPLIGGIPIVVLAISFFISGKWLNILFTAAEFLLAIRAMNTGLEYLSQQYIAFRLSGIVMLLLAAYFITFAILSIFMKKTRKALRIMAVVYLIAALVGEYGDISNVLQYWLVRTGEYGIPYENVLYSLFSIGSNTFGNAIFGIVPAAATYFVVAAEPLPQPASVQTEENPE